MNTQQKELVQRHLLDQGAPLSADEYRQLRREIAADPELSRYFNQLADASVDDAGNPVMSLRQCRTLLSAANAHHRPSGRLPSSSRRLWFSGAVAAAAAGFAAILAVVSHGTAPSRQVAGKAETPESSGVAVFRGDRTTDDLPSPRCALAPQAGDVTSCPRDVPILVQGNLFPRWSNRAHLALITCDAAFSCDIVQRRDLGRDEGGVTLSVGPARPMRVFAVWTEETLTPAQLAEAAARLKLAGFDLLQSPRLPIGRALQSSTYLSP